MLPITDANELCLLLNRELLAPVNSELEAKTLEIYSKHSRFDCTRRVSSNSHGLGPVVQYGR